MPDRVTVPMCYDVVESRNLLPQFPQSVRNLFEHGSLEETPKELDPAFARSRWWKLLSNADVTRAAAQFAANAGFAVRIDDSGDDQDYRETADCLLEHLDMFRREGPRVCLINGGEVTVRVEGSPGTGGRNQHFAAWCADKIARQRITVFSAGTDGIDGNSPAAGAVVDGSTYPRADAAGLRIAEALANFDTFPLFEKLGDAVITGPTGNNLRDLRILLAY